MAGQTPKKKKSCSGWLLGCGLSLLLFVGFILVAGGIGYVLSRRTIDKTPLVTSIISPETDVQVEVNQPLPIQSEASYSSGVSRVEVYADGALLLAQDAPEGGTTSLSSNGTWTPLTSGVHVLTARGYGSDETFSDSSVVNVLVTKSPENITIDVDKIKKEPGTPNPSLADIASVYGMTPEELASRNPDLSGTSPTEPLPSGTHIDAPHPPSSPSPPTPPLSPPPGSPAAPTNLTTSALCTSATLNWADNSNDETGFRVYRLDPGAARPRVVADSLPANTITFTDTLPALGVYRYQVATVRAGREGLSLMASAETAGSCPLPAAPFGGTSDLVLSIAMVDTTSAYEGIYCYLKINDQDWERIPAGTSLLNPESSNNLYYNLTRLPGQGRFNLGPQPPASPVTLLGECVGRQGPLAPGLGGFSINHPQADWDGRMRTANGDRFHFSYCLGPASIPCTPTIPGTATYAGLFLDIPALLLNLRAPNILSVDVSTPADCASIASSFERLACAMAGIFGAQSIFPWQTITWDWQGTSFVPESSLTSYTVIRTVVDPATGSQSSIMWDVNRLPDGTLPKMSLSDNRDLHCGSRIEYRVQANQAGRHSRPSDPVSFTTPSCPTAANLTVTFETLNVPGHRDIGEGYLFRIGTKTDLELFGFICSGVDSTRSCGNVGYQDNYFYVRDPDSYPFSQIPNYTNVFTMHVTNPEQTVIIGSELYEVDTDWTGIPHYGENWDHFCVEEIALPHHTIAQWGTLNEPFTIECPTAQAQTSITGRITGSPAR